MSSEPPPPPPPAPLPTISPPVPIAAAGSSAPAPAPVAAPASIGTTNLDGSRESSEFEFVEQGKANRHATRSPAPPSTRPAHLSSSSSGVSSASSPTTAGSTPSPSPFAGGASTSSRGNEPGSGLMGWMRGASGGLLTKVAEKTKSSLETVITTLDPQMREHLYSGGDVEVIVATDLDAPVGAVRQAFQRAFGRATVYGLACRQTVSVAEQPVGFAAGRQAALERIQALRAGGGGVAAHDVVVAVESFLLEVGDDAWADLSCLVLSDPAHSLSLTCYSQPTPVPAVFVQRARADTPDDYPKRWSGLAVPVGEVMAREWQVPVSQWHEVSCGVSQREMLVTSAATLAGLYRRALSTADSEEKST